MTAKIICWIKTHRAFCVYFIISCFVTLLDMAVSRLGELLLPLVAANTAGVVTGFATQYFLTSRKVYNNKNLATFAKFLLTFLFGLLLANGIVYACREWIFHGSDSAFAFLASKGASIAAPFFLLYFIRKYWIKAPEPKGD
ncbi:MAG: GtrA family protein [Oscillospiraceae bacterium]|nr:GtrA family protein [Oscillospiraceae bacterium]